MDVLGISCLPSLIQSLLFLWLCTHRCWSIGIARISLPLSFWWGLANGRPCRGWGWKTNEGGLCLLQTIPWQVTMGVHCLSTKKYSPCQALHLISSTTLAPWSLVVKELSIVTTSGLLYYPLWVFLSQRYWECSSETPWDPATLSETIWGQIYIQNYKMLFTFSTTDSMHK